MTSASGSSSSRPGGTRGSSGSARRPTARRRRPGAAGCSEARFAHEPVQAVQSRVGASPPAPASRLLAAEHRRREAGGAGQPALAVLSRRGEEHGLEQLADDAEGERALQLGRRAPRASGSPARAPAPGGADQARLADAAGSLDDEHLPRTVVGALERRRDGGKLALALERLVSAATAGDRNRYGEPAPTCRGAASRTSSIRGAGRRKSKGCGSGAAPDARGARRRRPSPRPLPPPPRSPHAHHPPPRRLGRRPRRRAERRRRGGRPRARTARSTAATARRASCT